MQHDDRRTAPDDYGIFYSDIGGGRALPTFGATDSPVELEQFAALASLHEVRMMVFVQKAARSAENMGTGWVAAILADS